jgi:hypothetical protein
MTCKIIFTVPFYHSYGAQPLCLLGCYIVGLYSCWSLLHTSSRTISHHLPTSFRTCEKKRGNRETDLKNKMESSSLPWVISLSLLFHDGVG